MDERLLRRWELSSLDTITVVTTVCLLGFCPGRKTSSKSLCIFATWKHFCCAWLLARLSLDGITVYYALTGVRNPYPKLLRTTDGYLAQEYVGQVKFFHRFVISQSRVRNMRAEESYFLRSKFNVIISHHFSTMTYATFWHYLLPLRHYYWHGLANANETFFTTSSIEMAIDGQIKAISSP